MKAEAAKHIHNRKVSFKKSKNKKIKLLDNITLVVSTIIPLATLPQIYNLWVLQDGSGVSATAWGLYFVLTIPLLFYGIVHKSKPLIIMYGLWLVMHAATTIGAIIY